MKSIYKALILVFLILSMFLGCTPVVREVRTLELSGMSDGAMYALDNETVFVSDNLSPEHDGSYTVNIRTGDVKKYPDLTNVESSDRNLGYLIVRTILSDGYEWGIRAIKLGQKDGESRIARLKKNEHGKFELILYAVPEMKETIIDMKIVEDQNPKIASWYRLFGQYGFILGRFVVFCSDADMVLMLELNERNQIINSRFVHTNKLYLKPVAEKIFIGAELQRAVDEDGNDEWALVAANPFMHDIKKTTIRMTGKNRNNLNTVFVTMPDQRTVVYFKDIVYPYSNDEGIGKVVIGIAEVNN